MSLSEKVLEMVSNLVPKEPDVERLQGCYRRVFDSPDGQIILDDLIKRFHVFRTTFRPDPNHAAFLEGQRYVVVNILNFIEKDISQIKPEL